jgi:hypothetical protein
LRTCSKCQVTKETSEFGKHKGTKDGLRPECKQCRNARPYDPKQQLNNYLKSAYNITLKEYDALLADQTGVCALCGTDYPGKQGRFVVDHNHTTGEVRGLLCNQCNVGLGALQDNPALLLKAAQYLIDRGYYGKSYV